MSLVSLSMSFASFSSPPMSFPWPETTNATVLSLPSRRDARASASFLSSFTRSSSDRPALRGVVDFGVELLERPFALVEYGDGFVAGIGDELFACVQEPLALLGDPFDPLTRAAYGQRVLEGHNLLLHGVEVRDGVLEHGAYPRKPVVKGPVDRVAVGNPVTVVCGQDVHFALAHEACVDEPEFGVLRDFRIGKDFHLHEDGVVREFHLEDFTLLDTAYDYAVARRERSDLLVAHHEAVARVVGARGVEKVPGKTTACNQYHEHDKGKQVVLYEVL